MRICPLVLVCALLVSAHPAHAQGGWFDGNFISISPTQEEHQYTSGLLTTSTNVPLVIAQLFEDSPAGLGFGFEAGYAWKTGLGVGGRYDRVSFEIDGTASIATTHPLFLDLLTGDAQDTTFDRTDSTLDLMAVFVFPIRNPSVRVRAFGGPTYFTVKQEMVENVEFTRTFNLSGTVNTVEIDAIEKQEVDGSAWGFHLGADVGYFFSRYVGIGANLKWSQATIRNVDIPIDGIVVLDEEAAFDAGGLTFGGGIRLRF